MAAFLVGKSDLKKFEQAILFRFERMTGSEEIYRADHGGEYTSEAQREKLFMMGIHQEFSDTQTAFQNGLAQVIGGMPPRIKSGCTIEFRLIGIRVVPPRSKS